MSAASDLLLVVSVLAYLAAMVAHAAQTALRERGAPAPAAERQPALSGVAVAGARPAFPVVDRGAPPSTPAGGSPATSAGAPPAGDRPARLAWLVDRVALSTLLLAVAAHAATTVTRGLAAQRVPWGNMYEFLLSATLVGAVAWLVVRFRHPAARHLGLYVSLANLVLLGLAGMVLYVPVGPLVPALDSYWLLIHVASAATATGIFLVGFVAAVMYLIRVGHDRQKTRFPYPLGARMPAAATLERLTFRVHAFAFPIWTFAVIAGAIWAEAAWGRYWDWDPKEVWSFVSWIVYAGYLHARATPHVRRTTAAWLAVVGFLTMLMNLFGVNFFFTGLHSYAG
jgi:cytochrome c-type biogenesis protein CcsB